MTEKKRAGRRRLYNCKKKGNQRGVRPKNYALPETLRISTGRRQKG